MNWALTGGWMARFAALKWFEGAGNGGGGTSGGGGGAAGGGTGGDSTALLEEFRRMMRDANGDRGALADRLYNRVLEQDGLIATLRGQVPTEGQVVLSQADAARWKAYQELGKPDDLKTIVTEHGHLKQKDAERSHDEAVTRGAAAEGLDPAVLKPLAKGLTIELRQEGGKEVAYVKLEGGDKRLGTYAEEHPDWKPMLSVLKKPLQATETETGTGNRGGGSGGNNDGAPPAAGAKPDGDKIPFRFQQPGDVSW
jgi:hypothetical protein